MTIGIHATRVSPMPEWHEFGPSHCVALMIAAIACFNVVYFRRELSGARVDIWLTVAMTALHVAWIVYCLRSGYAPIGQLLPLYTCDAAIVLSLAWCLTKPLWLGQVIFYWTFLGGVVTLLMPDTDGYTFPNFVAVHAVVFHVLMLMLALEIWTGEGLRPSWTSLVPVCVATLMLVPPSLAANAAYGSDYMFVSRTPGGLFTFLGRAHGASRVLLTLAAGAGLLILALLTWFALDRLLQRLAEDSVRPTEEGAPAG